MTRWPHGSAPTVRAADRALVREAAARLGRPFPVRWSAGERLLWRRWAPLVAALPEIDRWSADDRAALVEAIRAKGGARESDAVAPLTAHGPFRRALAGLMAPPDRRR